MVLKPRIGRYSTNVNVRCFHKRLCEGIDLFQQVKIAPSILSGNFLDMKRTLADIEQNGADWVHIDVMDGHFVPNITMGIPLVKQLRGATTLTLDAHLMVTNPIDQIPWFLDAGADMVTFHMECVTEEEAASAIDTIHDAHALAAAAIKPDAPVDVLRPIIDRLDMVLVMSVFPGFSGQSYIEGSEMRVLDVSRMAKEAGCSPLIQVDGGISTITARRVVASGADVLVCGNAFFNAEDKSKFCNILHSLT